MTYLDELCDLARSKGIDPQQIIDDVVNAAIATNWGVEDIARSFVMAVRRDEKEYV